MHKFASLVVTGAALSAFAGVAAIAQNGGVPKDAQAHMAKAKALAGSSYMQATYSLQCGLSGRAITNFQTTTVSEPAKLFDNVYYVGLKSVGAYAIQTKSGIILIDSLNNSEEAQNVIEPGLRKLGLDPAQVKYVVVTHGHGDHYGGASYFAEKYGAHVMLSEADWSFMSQPMPPPPPGAPPRPNSPKPVKDLIARDGMVLELGGQQVRIVETPGHTPGTISLIIPVTDKGRPHVLAMWGGTGVPRDAELRAKYIASSIRFGALSSKAGADIELSNHPFVDASLDRIAQMQASKAKANPLIIGPAAYGRYTKIITECAKAVHAGGPTAN
ncbi:MAG: MBL fold metallo-hydrolase [Novosphingobium sp.]